MSLQDSVDSVGQRLCKLTGAEVKKKVLPGQLRDSESLKTFAIATLLSPSIQNLEGFSFGLCCLSKRSKNKGYCVKDNQQPFKYLQE
jgi:hypothetical protein